MTGMYRTNRKDVPLVDNLDPEEGWIRMQVQFLIDKETANSDDLLLGWTVIPPGGRHDRHRHPRADEFFIVLQGSGLIYTDDGEEPSSEGDVIFTRRGHWHGFNNTGTEDAILVWGWSGAGSLDTAGYEVDLPGTHDH